MADVVRIAAAIWPIIGHIAQLFRLWDRLILSMAKSASFDNSWQTDAFLVLHPFPRLLQQRLIRLTARFANFVMGLKDGPSLMPGGNTTSLDIEVARSVLSDLILSNRVKYLFGRLNAYR